MISTLVTLIVWLLVIGILWWLLIYVLDAVPVPDPPNRMIKIVVTVLMVLAIVLVILNVFGVDTGVDMPKLS